MFLFGLMMTLVVLMCAGMFSATRLWFLDHWRRAHDLAREELSGFASARDGEFRLGDEVPDAGSAAVEIAGCVCHAAFHFRWVETRSREKRATKCLLVTKTIAADLRDYWTDRYDPASFVAMLPPKGRKPAFNVKATPFGLTFRAGPRMPLDELADAVAKHLELYVQQIDEANRPVPRIYRS